MSTIDKKFLRQHARARRQAISAEQKNSASEAICQHIMQLQSYREAHHIALYHAMDEEVDLSLLWNHAMNHHKICYIPRMNPDKSLAFVPVDEHTRFIKQASYIPEPDVALDKKIDVHQLDFMCLPLLAFDAHGNRLGFGQGCYDRTLAKARPKTLAGIAYEVQRCDFIPVDPWDIPMTTIITEQGPTYLYLSNNSGRFL